MQIIHFHCLAVYILDLFISRLWIFSGNKFFKFNCQKCKSSKLFTKLENPGKQFCKMYWRYVCLYAENAIKTSSSNSKSLGHEKSLGFIFRSLLVFVLLVLQFSSLLYRVSVPSVNLKKFSSFIVKLS